MNFENATIKQKLKNLPLCPGVYIMKNSEGDVIYVGKSKLLKNRVSQYFMNSKNHSQKTLSMVSNVADFDYMVTDTEVEALVLECNLIKKYRPKYNILLKDDKQYPFIKITVQDEFPRIYMTRQIKKDGAKYFGPYMSSFVIKETIETIKKIFKVRSCNKNLPKDIGKTRPCLFYHINQCSAPCDNKISKEEYREVIDKITDVLNGKFNKLLKDLKEEMIKASDNLEFEKAARYRDKIEGIKVFGEKQKITSTKEDNRDIIGLYQDDSHNCIEVFYMRGGKIVGSESFVMENDNSSKEELISGFIKQYYLSTTLVPKEILLPLEIEDSEQIAIWLSEKCGHKISVLTPKKGKKLALIDMVCKNAEEALSAHRFKVNREILKENLILNELMTLLSLEKPPYRIETYDISNISGADSIGVCVVYKNAKEYKKAYRKFNIKTVEGANDFESTREVIYRRFTNAYKEQDAIREGKLSVENAKFLPLPDLILLDGGRGHVNSIKILMETLGENIPIFGLVKDDKHKTKGITDENAEIPISKDGDLFNFLTQMQEEVHRFAIRSFRKKHQDTAVFSELLKISGVGPSKHKLLMQTFISVDRIKKATIDELSMVVDNKTAKNIYDYFNGGHYDKG